MKKALQIKAYRFNYILMFNVISGFTFLVKIIKTGTLFESFGTNIDILKHCLNDNLISFLTEFAEYT